MRARAPRLPLLISSLGFVIVVGGIPACGGAPRPPAQDPITVRPAVYDAATMRLIDIADGDTIDLVRPPQGGYVLFIGASLVGAREPFVKMTATLRDASGVVATDARNIAVAASPGDPTVSIPDLRSYVNVPNVTMCPSASATDRDGVPFMLDVSVTEPMSQRQGTRTLTVTPACRMADTAARANCVCLCQGGFVLGKCA
jgi:hypothetical protein